MKRRPLERSGERGAIAVLMALLLTVLMGFGALGFDLSYVRLARMEMKTASDAAAHAGMMVLRLTHGDVVQARNAAISVASKNSVLKQPVLLDPADVVFGGWDYDTSTFTAGATPTNAVQINGRKSDPTAADGTVQTTFGRTIGFTSAAVSQTSFGAYRPRAMMFEMDVTGSFLQASCAINEAIAADLAFLDAMFAAASAKDRIGLDVFTGEAFPFTPLQLIQPASNYNNIRNDWQGDGVSALSASHERGLGVCTQDPVRTDATWVCGAGVPGTWPNQNFLKPGIAMPHCWDHDPTHFTPPTTTVEVWGGTNIGAAIKRGKDTLLAVGHTYEVRSIVVFTDGGPLCCEAKAGGALCPTAPGTNCCADTTTPGCVDHGTGACACSNAIRLAGVDEANLAEAEGIDVYVLAFGGYAPWISYARSLARGRGYTLDTNDRLQLQAKLEEFAYAIPVALVK